MARLPTTWWTADGRRLLIEEMSDQHIVNTFRMLKRNPPLPGLYIGLRNSLALFMDAEATWGNYMAAFTNQMVLRGLNENSNPDAEWLEDLLMDFGSDEFYED